MRKALAKMSIKRRLFLTRLVRLSQRFLEALYAHYISYIYLSSFTVAESIFILSIVIIGGMGNLTGSFLASAFMILLPEFLRFVGLPNNIAANMRQIIYGAILVFVMMSGKMG